MGITDLGRPLRRAEARDGVHGGRGWPYTIPAVAALLRDGVDFPQATILVGENGSGKSTIIEAIAEAYGFSPEGGSTGARFETRRTESALGADLQLVRGIGSGKGGYFFRAETMHGLFTYLDSTLDLPSNLSEFHHRSHGEAFRDILSDRTRYANGQIRPGLYLFDEPESALSFSSSLHVLAELMELLSDPGVQVIMATHSPVLAALPGATILELSEDGLQRTAWDDLELVVNERHFLANPERFLRYLRDEP